MFNFSRQERIVYLIIISLLLVLFGWKLYKQEQSTITIVSNEKINSEDISEEDIAEYSFYIVHVAGAVKKPGVYTLAEGERIIDALKMAGGETEKANLDAINLARPIYDGQKIYFPFISEINENNFTEKTILQNMTSSHKNSTADSLINLNSADSSQLEVLPGIGPALAQRILDFRNNNGLFRSIEEIMNVTGIGEKRFDSIKEYITAY